MKTFKDKKVIALILILIVFTISYFVIANKISYAFSESDNSEFYHDKINEIIKYGAIEYAKAHESEFTENNNVKYKYVTVQELIDTSFLIPDSEGYIKDPLNAKEILNQKSIQIRIEDGNITVEIAP